MENQNPGRSVKDRAALHIIDDAMCEGQLKSGDNLYESTSGSTGISLGLVCNVKGVSTRIYLNDDLAQEKVSHCILLVNNFNLFSVRYPSVDWV